MALAAAIASEEMRPLSCLPQAMLTAAQIARSTGAKKLTCAVIDDSAVRTRDAWVEPADWHATFGRETLIHYFPGAQTQTPTTAERHKAITFVFEEARNVALTQLAPAPPTVVLFADRVLCCLVLLVPQAGWADFNHVERPNTPVGQKARHARLALRSTFSLRAASGRALLKFPGAHVSQQLLCSLS